MEEVEVTIKRCGVCARFTLNAFWFNRRTQAYWLLLSAAVSTTPGLGIEQ